MNEKQAFNNLVAMALSKDVVDEVEMEIVRQCEKWGGPREDDKRKTPEDWANDIEAYVVWARQMHRMGSPEKYRKRMMQIAALAISACASFDRQASR